MADNLVLLDARQIEPNPENPRLIFRAEELDALEKSIARQGILVPLTVYEDKRKYIILDGERRWRCALKLGVKIPVIVQPKPDKMTNIMMMFAIHNKRKDWDPLPTAVKLSELEAIATKRYGRKPTERELSELASLSVSEVRRYKQLLALPQEYRDELMAELEKPRSQQVLTVDHVLEATKAAGLLRKRGIVDFEDEDRLRKSLISKFKSGTIRSTVEPRKLARLARAVEREEVGKPIARQVVSRLIRDPSYTVERAFSESVEAIDFQHTLSQLTDRARIQIQEHTARGYELSPQLRDSLEGLKKAIDEILEE